MKESPKHAQCCEITREDMIEYMVYSGWNDDAPMITLNNHGRMGKEDPPRYWAITPHWCKHSVNAVSSVAEIIITTSGLTKAG